MSDIKKIEDITPGELKVGDRVQSVVRGTDEAPLILADNTLVFGIGPQVEVLLILNQNEDITVEMEVAGIVGPAVNFLPKQTKSSMSQRLVARLRISESIAVQLANNLRLHIKANHSGAAGDLLP